MEKGLALAATLRGGVIVSDWLVSTEPCARLGPSNVLFLAAQPSGAQLAPLSAERGKTRRAREDCIAPQNKLGGRYSTWPHCPDLPSYFGSALLPPALLCSIAVVTIVSFKGGSNGASWVKAAIAEEKRLTQARSGKYIEGFTPDVHLALEGHAPGWAQVVFLPTVRISHFKGCFRLIVIKFNWCIRSPRFGFVISEVSVSEFLWFLPPRSSPLPGFPFFALRAYLSARASSCM